MGLIKIEILILHSGFVLFTELYNDEDFGIADEI
jgi:hypothetical protein